MKEMILYSSNEAAQIKEVKGWVSSIGRFWGDDEHMARFDGCTHIQCENADHPPYSVRSYCRICTEEQATKRYFERPAAEYNGGYIYCNYHDRYFMDLDKLRDAVKDETVGIDDLQLSNCIENNLTQFDFFDYWADVLFENNEPSAQVMEAIDALNEAIKKHGKGVSVSPDDSSRIDLSKELKQD